MKPRSKPVLVLSVIVVLIALFLFRPGAARLNHRIASSIGAMLQRQVEISAVHLRLLPRPGFDLDGFVVHDDPSFSAEPVLRAQEVTASLRLTSLLRGHLAIARLSLTEPSLNLVRRGDGRWNVETFLERTAIGSPSRTPASNSGSEFPYIEADRGRINFKFGSEKKPFALTDATYSLWQDSDTYWGMRLKGQPVRTDFNVSDTGRISVSGNWARGVSSLQTPLRFTARWEEAQLGQLSKALTGEDRGWRGTVNLTLNGVGTPSNLALQADASLGEFRRYDISENPHVELHAQCKALLNAQNRALKQAICDVPMGDRNLELTGEITHLTGPRNYDLQVSADKVATDSLLAVIRHVKKDLPADLQATGTLDAKLRARTDEAGQLVWAGSGRTDNLHLKSESNKTDLAFDVIPFSLVWASAAEDKRRPRTNRVVTGPTVPHLLFGPVPLKLGRLAAVSLQGWFGRQAYNIAIKGDSEIQKLEDAARVVGIPVHRVAARGNAKLDLQVAGVWQGFPAPIATGTIELHQVEADLRGSSALLEIASARLLLTTTGMEVSGFTASAAGAHWSGTARIPRGCASSELCQASFDLHADVVSTDAMHDWWNPKQPERPWYELTSGSDPGPSVLAGVRASGTLSADRFEIRDFEADHVAAKVELNRARLHLFDLRADILGGKHTGEWRADFSVKPPTFSGSGSLENVSLAHVAGLMRDPWISGTSAFDYELGLSGLSSAELSGSAKGTLRFEAQDGDLLHMKLNGVTLPIRRFNGTLAIERGNIELQHATLVSADATYAVSGKASLARKLDLTFARQDGSGFRVAGTLADPTIAPARRSETRAALKP